MSLIFSLLTLAAGQKIKRPEFVRYQNARYGYSVEIPSFLILQREAKNDQGRSYLSKDVRTELLVYGLPELLDEKGAATTSLAGGYRRWLEQARKKGPPKFAKLDSDVFAVSWREGRRLLYVKTIRLPEGFATVEITYPHDRGPAVDMAIARTMASLKAAKR